jgi:Protein of unknown function (DUF2630)
MFPAEGVDMNDEDLLARIQALVEEEHTLRDGAGDGQAPDQGRLQQVEERLDQAWDLLRQRRAKAESGENPNEAEPRPVSEVEGYKQ